MTAGMISNFFKNIIENYIMIYIVFILCVVRKMALLLLTYSSDRRQTQVLLRKHMETKGGF